MGMKKIQALTKNVFFIKLEYKRKMLADMTGVAWSHPSQSHICTFHQLVDLWSAFYAGFCSQSEFKIVFNLISQLAETPHCRSTFRSNSLKNGKNVWIIVTGIILMNFPKFFSCFQLELPLTKFAAYGSDENFKRYIYPFRQKQCVRVNNVGNCFDKVVPGLPQRSTVSQSFYNLFLLISFLSKKKPQLITLQMIILSVALQSNLRFH